MPPHRRALRQAQAAEPTRYPQEPGNDSHCNILVINHYGILGIRAC